MLLDGVVLCAVVDNARGKKIITLTVKRRPAYVYMSLNSNALTGMTLCNTHVSMVRDARLTYYICAYQTKSHSEELNVFLSVVNEFKRHKERVDAVENDVAALAATIRRQLEMCTDAAQAAELRSRLAKCTPRTDYSRGVGHLLSGVRARSGDEVIPSQMAAFLILGGHVYSYSDEFAPLPVAQSVAFLKGQPYTARVLRRGRLSATINDYAHRPPLPQFDNMHQWQFVSEYMVQKIAKNRSRARPRASDPEGQPRELQDLGM
jgi:hypothetical protein